MCWRTSTCHVPCTAALAFFAMVLISGCGGGGSGGAESVLPPRIMAITVSPSDLTLQALGATAQLEATARDQNGNTLSAQFSWGSSDPTVVRVDGDGVVTASSNGMVTVTVRSGSVSASATVTVEQQPASISLSPDEVALSSLGAEQRLEARVVDANDNAMSAQLAWESSDPAVASVDETGKITAKANGTATVTAMIGSISASVDVTVRVPLTVSGDPNARDSRTGRTPLHVAAMANAPRLIGALLKAGADLEARDRDGLTPMHAAANSPAAVAALLEAGANLESRNNDGQTPLQFAVHGSGETTAAAVALLLKAGANPNAQNVNGTTPLHRTACDAGHERDHNNSGAMEALAALLEAGADPNARDIVGETPLHKAASAMSLAVVRALVQADADPDARDDKGWTPLRQAVALAKDPAIVTVLLEAGADIATRDDDGEPLLHLAAKRDRPATVVLLLEAGAALTAHDNAGRTALHAAASSTEPGIPVPAAAASMALLLAGADPNALDDSGLTAMQLVPPDSRAMMTALFDAHAGRTVGDPNASDRFGYTALHAAARANTPTLIAALVEAGADVDALDNDGHTPLLLAVGASRSHGRNAPTETFNVAAIMELAAAGADLELRDRYDRTALLLAARWGEVAAIEVLVEAGADLEARNMNGNTALQLALSEGQAAATLILAEAEAGFEEGDYKDFAAVLALTVGNSAALAESGLDPNARDDRGRTVLHWAWAWASSTGLAALADAGADLNARDNKNRTPLVWAAERRRPATVAALARAGADLNARDYNGTALHWAVLSRHAATVAAVAAAGADLEVRDRNGWTALQLAAYRGEQTMIAVLVEAGADIEARDDSGRTALQLAAGRDYPARWTGGPSTPAAIAALVEAEASLEAHDNVGNTALYAAVAAGNQAATGTLVALGVGWTNDPEAHQPEINARVVAVELFQGPMVWQWELVEQQATVPDSVTHDGSFTDHAKTLLHRATTVAVRIGSEHPDPVPELSVNLRDAAGSAWASVADPVLIPRIVSVPSHSESGLWETEYVYELPVDWADSGHRASFAIDPYNRLEETDETDNTATLTMDGHAVPVFEVTFVPIVFSGDPIAVDVDTYMAVIGDLLPIGQYRAQVGRPLDLSDRNLGSFNKHLSNDTALHELLHRWNAEAGENEYYYGLISSAELVVFGFGGVALLGGNVAVSDPIAVRRQVQREFCGNGVHAHEIGHNLGLSHAPGRCNETEPIDADFPYPSAGIGPRRGWVASRNEFVNPGDDNQYFDVMGYCNPRFVSDYNYNKMVDYRLGSVEAQPDASERKGPSLEIGPNRTSASPTGTLSAPSPAYAHTPGVASPSGASGPGVAGTGTVNAIDSSLAFTGTLDAFGLWSTYRIDASTQPPRPPSSGAEYFFTLWDAYQREIYREPMALLTSAHGDTLRSWAVRVPVPEQSPAFLAIFDASGTPIFIEPIDASTLMSE